MIPYPPEMPPGIWSFNPEKGHLKVVDDSFAWPNGIALSSDEKTFYVSHTPLKLGGGIAVDITAPR
jgi:sugar lactone lactonase YvrE